MTWRSLTASESWRRAAGEGMGETGLGVHEEEEEDEDEAGRSAGFMS